MLHSKFVFSNVPAEEKRRADGVSPKPSTASLARQSRGEVVDVALDPPDVLTVPEKVLGFKHVEVHEFMSWIVVDPEQIQLLNFVKMSPSWVSGLGFGVLGDKIYLGRDDLLIPTMWTLTIFDKVSVESEHVLWEVVLGDALDGLAGLRRVSDHGGGEAYWSQDLLDCEHVEGIVAEDAPEEILIDLRGRPWSQQVDQNELECLIPLLPEPAGGPEH